MKLEKKVKLIEFIDSEIGKVSDNVQKVKVTLSHSLSGHSDAGDRYHAQNAQGMVNEYLERLKKLKREIEMSSVEKFESVKPVSFVEIKYQDGNTLAFYFAESAVNLPGYLLISKESPMGKAVFGKKSKDAFSYIFEQDGVKKIFKGSITKIE